MTTVVSKGQRKKPKSPPVPSRSLEDSFDDVRKLYNAYTHATFSKSEIASTLGVSADAGPFAQRLFTLKAYGLITPSGQQFRVSDLFRTMKESERGEAAFKRAALSAIRESNVFSSLLDEFNNKLPPQSTVASRLEANRSFNPDRAKLAARVLHESLKFAGVLDANGNILPIRDEPAVHGTAGEAENGTEANSGVQGPEQDRGYSGGIRIQVPLARGRVASVLVPHDMSAAEARKIASVLLAASEEPSES